MTASIHLWCAKEGANYCGVVSFTEPSTLDPETATHRGCLESAANGGVIVPCPASIRDASDAELRSMIVARAASKKTP